MTDSPNNAAAHPGWYLDPAGSGRLRWWDGVTWTEHFGGAPFRNSPAARPEIGPQTPVYNPFIWLIVLLPLVSVVLQFTWNPVLRYRYIGSQRIPTLDPTSMFTPAYFLLIAAGFLIYGVSVLLAYLDSQRLSRDGVVRPFAWAWAFLGPMVYIIGRSVIVHKVAPRRGLAPIWVLIADIVISFILVSIKFSAIFSAIATTIPR